MYQLGTRFARLKHTNQAAQPNHAKDAPNPDGKIPKHLKEPKEKDEDLKTQKAPGNTQRGNADPKTQKRPGANQGVNSNPNTQKVPEVIQGGEPRKPENSRAKRRRESQLITAAPLESSTLRWTPRCLLYTSPSPRDLSTSRMPSSA